MLARSLLVSTATARAFARFTASRLRCHGRVAEHHRDVEGPRAGEKAVVLVALEDDHRLAGQREVLEDAQSDRAEPDQDHVVAHPGGELAAERLCDPPADEQVGEHGVQDRHQRGTDDHQYDRPDPQPGRLISEEEITESHGRERFGGEVRRVQDAHPRAVGGAVADPQEHDGQNRHREQQPQRRPQLPFGHAHEPADVTPQPGLATVAAARAGRLDVVGQQLAILQVRSRADHDHPIAGAHRQVAARTHVHLAAVRGHHGDRREIAEQRAQGAVRRSAWTSRNDERVTGDDRAPGVQVQAGLGESRRGERGDVEHARGPVTRATARPTAALPSSRQPAVSDASGARAARSRG